MKLAIFLGPPGVGKGTQCSLLSTRLNFHHISTGSIIRKEIETQSELGLQVKNLVEAGNLVDDTTIFLCLEKAFQNLQCSSNTTILLDGLPRNLAQAHHLNMLTKKLFFSSVQVICFEAHVEQLIQRFESRFTCSHCGNSHSIVSEQQTSLSHFQCDVCKTVGSLKRRKDDEASTVRHRLDVYRTETLPLVSFYQERNIIHFVNALFPPEIVYLQVATFLT